MASKTATNNASQNETSFRYSFSLSPEMVLINWRKVAPSNDSDMDIDDPLEKDDLPGKPGRKTATGGLGVFHATLQNLEARHAGKHKVDDYGYENLDDWEIASEDEYLSASEDEELAHGGFYVNTGDIETRKRNRDEVEGDFSDSEDEYDRKRYKYAEEETKSLAPEVEELVQELEKAIESNPSLLGTQDPSSKRASPLSNELEPYIRKIALMAIEVNANKYLTSDVVNRVAHVVGFAASTMRVKMRDLIKKTESASTTPSTSSNTQQTPSQHIDATSKLKLAIQAVDKEMLACLNDLDSSASASASVVSSKLEELKNSKMVTLRTDIVAYLRQLASLENYEKYPIWSLEIRALILQVLRIQDTIVNVYKLTPGSTISGSLRQTKSALYTEIVEMWPASWNMNNSKATAMVAAALNKIRKIFPEVDQLPLPINTGTTKKSKETSQSGNNPSSSNDPKPSNGSSSTSSKSGNLKHVPITVTSDDPNVLPPQQQNTPKLPKSSSNLASNVQTAPNNSASKSTTSKTTSNKEESNTVVLPDSDSMHGSVNDPVLIDDPIEDDSEDSSKSKVSNTTHSKTTGAKRSAKKASSASGEERTDSGSKTSSNGAKNSTPITFQLENVIPPIGIEKWVLNQK